MMLFTDILFAAYDVRPGDAGDEAINESHKYINLLLVDNSLVYFFFLKL